MDLSIVDILWLLCAAVSCSIGGLFAVCDVILHEQGCEKDVRDGDVLPFESVWISSVLLFVLLGVSPFTPFSGVFKE